MELKQKLEDHREMIPAYGLGVFMLVAGLSKFVILDLWLGYEPRFLVELVPLTARQLTMLGGLFEASLGLALLSGRKTFHVSLVVAVYLFLITLQLASFRLWDLAVRDFGLMLYALSIAVWNYGR
jgi:uncharacterized membrane protein YphA (DoxX/SURF4 family)